MSGTKSLPGAIFLSSLLVCMIWGFGSSLTVQWPGFALLGLAALILGITNLRNLSRKSDLFGGLCLLSGLALSGYILVRGLTSPVPYFAREDLALAAV